MDTSKAIPAVVAPGGISDACPRASCADALKLLTEERDRLKAEKEALNGKYEAVSVPSDSEGKAACLDCGLPYEDFPMDMLLPRAQWLAIHPEGENGLLCALCMVRRASKIPGATVIHAVVEISQPQPHRSDCRLNSWLNDGPCTCGGSQLEDAERRLSTLSDELKVTDAILVERQRVLNAIPACPMHGPCVPHALEWIAKMVQALGESKT